MIVIYDLRPARTILAECRDLRRQAREFPSVAAMARHRIGTNRYTLAAIRSNRAELRRASHAA